jgi:hypothetical protein
MKLEKRAVSSTALPSVEMHATLDEVQRVRFKLLKFTTIELNKQKVPPSSG